ncbi:hypothetical protein [uncultured Gelidibacter sp.]|uniref:hypothetical protein n=1 Tax=uncultured Gelidibacter sp. TaxID=259318 RepID=UPI00262CC285|nr:hypothetical protein [uncultured Gelidibacter sp.]
MNRWHALLPNWAIFTVLTLIVVLNLISSYFQFYSISNAITLALIPVLLTSYFYKLKFMETVFFAIFMLYFCGIAFNLFPDFSLSEKLSESSFLGAYALMIFIMLGRLKHVKFEGVVTWYLVVVAIINTYLMYAMFANVKDYFNDSVVMTLAVSKGIMLLIMAFLAFAIYLSKETSQAIIFLTVVCCFAFADVLDFTTTMYVQFWVFEGFQKVLQGLGLFLLCIYTYNHQEYTKGVLTNDRTESIRKSKQLTA